MARHYSPPGTYERIRKSVLEDPSLTNAEFRLALYLVTKPDRWVIHPRQLAGALDRTVNEIETALRGLRRRGLVAEEVTRTPGSGRRITSRQRRFRRDLVVHPDGQLLDGESAIQDLTSTDGKPAGQLSNGECAIQEPTCDDGKTPGQVLDGTPLDSREPSPLERTHTQSDLWGTSPLDPPLGTGAQTAAGVRPPDGRHSGAKPRAPSRRAHMDSPGQPDGPHHDGPAPSATVLRAGTTTTGTVQAVPAGAGSDGDRAPRERAHAGEAGVCARPGCGEPVTGRQRYCSARCRKSEENRRRAERKNRRPATEEGQARIAAALAARAARRTAGQAAQ